MFEILEMQKHEANAQFGKFIEAHYINWLNGKDKNAPVLSHTLMKNKVVPLLDQVELCQIETGSSQVRVLDPSIEIASVGHIVVDQARQNAGDQWVAITIGFQVILDGLRIAFDAAGLEERFGIRRAETGERFAADSGDGLAGRVDQDARYQTGADQHLGFRGARSAEEVVVVGADGRHGSRWAIWSVAVSAFSSASSAASARW